MSTELIVQAERYHDEAIQAGFLRQLLVGKPGSVAIYGHSFND